MANAFVLYRLFKEMMREHEATAFTIKSCMGTILPMAQTTACPTLSLLNDEGLRDSHWVMAYGNWLKELGYATRKIGVQWVSLADAA